MMAIGHCKSMERSILGIVGEVGQLAVVSEARGELVAPTDLAESIIL